MPAHCEVLQSDSMSIEARLEGLGIVLPEAPRGSGNYLPARRVGQLCFLSGVVSSHRGSVLTGTVGGDRTLQDAYAAARACGMLHLAALRTVLGSLDAVEGMVSVTGYINAARGLTELAPVMNGYSDLMIDVFGEAGRHARAAVGVSSLPRGAMIEVQAVASLKS